MVELEESAGSGASPNLLDKAMAGIASPLSPELLNAVDPRVINDGALLSFEKNRNGKGKTTNSAETDKPDLSVAGIPVMERLICCPQTTFRAGSLDLTEKPSFFGFAPFKQG